MQRSSWLQFRSPEDAKRRRAGGAAPPAPLGGVLAAFAKRPKCVSGQRACPRGAPYRNARLRVLPGTQRHRAVLPGSLSRPWPAAGRATAAGRREGHVQENKRLRRAATGRALRPLRRAGPRCPTSAVAQAGDGGAREGCVGFGD